MREKLVKDFLRKALSCKPLEVLNFYLEKGNEASFNNQCRRERQVSDEKWQRCKYCSVYDFSLVRNRNNGFFKNIFVDFTVEKGKKPAVLMNDTRKCRIVCCLTL